MDPDAALEPASAESTLNAISTTLAMLADLEDRRVETLELENELRSLLALLRNVVERPVDARMGTLLPKVTQELLELQDVFLQMNQTKGEARRRLQWNTRHKKKISKTRMRLNHSISDLGMLLSIQNLKALEDQASMRGEEIIIALMGETGSGKSSFINRVLAEDVATVGHGLQSETVSIQTYSLSIGGQIITLVDTPGFDDTFRSAAEVLREISDWLVYTYKSHLKLLSGIIYLQRIDESRMRGSALSNLMVFEALVGSDAMRNVVLTTTMWDRVNPSVGEMRESELKQKFWNRLIERGSITARAYFDRRSALAILERIAFDQREGSSSGARVALQREMVDENKPLEETAAGQSLSQRMDEMERSDKQEISKLTHELLEEREQASKERLVMQTEIENLRQKQGTLQEELAKMKQPVHTKTPEKTASFRLPVKADVLVHLESSDLLHHDDLPPPYSPRRVPSSMTAIINNVRTVVELSLTPIEEMRRLLGPYVAKAFRPRLQAGHSRVEWTCSCGDVLYGDYVERTPGSLQSLAVELGGKFISGPASSQTPAGSSGVPLQRPSQAHLQGGAASVSGSGSTRPTNQRNTPAQQAPPGSAPGSLNVGTANQTPTATKWLELCIRSSTDISILAEVDVAGAHNDQSVFNAIRRAYERNKKTARLFGSFAYRTPNGGVSVMFRKDKLANSTTGDPPTVSIMKRQCMPDAAEAQEYHYSFDPIPMDEPAIDARTFHHYLRYPHDADPSQAWMKRFPQLNDASLFYHPEKLAKGWGLEITEDRNWTLVVVANIVALLISGAVAGLFARLAKDNATGVAIGAWLTAVQTLCITAVFWRWTN